MEDVMAMRHCEGCHILGWTVPLFVRPMPGGPVVLCRTCMIRADADLAERMALAQPPFDRLVPVLVEQGRG
jgi:hypothetical protein